MRVGHRTPHSRFCQDKDKDSHWTYENGLKTLVPFHFTWIVGMHSFVLPDMIGGNAYVIRPSKELL